MYQHAEISSAPFRNTTAHRMRWSAITAGSLVALATWATLYTLGLAAGLQVLATGAPSARMTGFFTGGFGVLAPLVALFVGGYVASQGAQAEGRGTGVLHGLVMWSLSTLMFVYLVTTLFIGAAGGALGAGGQLLAGSGTAAGKLAEGACSIAGMGADGASLTDKMLDMAGIDVDTALNEVNKRLVAHGKPAIAPEAIKSSVKAIATDLVKEGSMDGRGLQVLRESLKRNTPLTEQDLDEVSTKLNTQIERSRVNLQEKMAQSKEQLQEAAMRASAATSQTLWAVFAVLLLGLLAAIGGGAMGAQPRSIAHLDS